jgi:uncharacterized membrane protein
VTWPLRSESDSGFDALLSRLRDTMRVEAGEAAVAMRVVYAAAAAYAALFVLAAVVHYTVFKTPRLDLGDMVQAIWSTRHGHFLQFTTLTGHQRDRLGFHVDPLLLVFVPLFWIRSWPLFLPIVQALAVASGSLPVFWLARKHLGSPRAGAHFALAFLLYPATQFNAFTLNSGFHAVSLAVPLVLYCIWFLDQDRLLAFSAVGLLAFATKEEIPLAVGCLGIWYAVRRGRRLFGASVFAVGLAFTLFDFLWVIPHFSPSGADPFAGRYAAVGGTPQGIAHKLFSDPVALMHAVASAHKAVYLVLLVVPFLGLWLGEPLLVLGALPDLAINFLSNSPDQTAMNTQYTAGIVPFLVAASIFGLARLKRNASNISLVVLALTAAIAVYSPILPLGGEVGALGSPLVAAKAHALRLIPGHVPVSATNQLGGHLSTRPRVYEFPYIRGSRWIIVDVKDSPYGSRSGIERYVRRYQAQKAWYIVFSSHGVSVLHKR